MSDLLDFIDDDDEDEEEEEQQGEGVGALLASRPAACGVMQFHNGIEESLLLTIERDSSVQTPEQVVAAVDKFCYSRHWMMHIGPVKGVLLDEVIRDAQGTENKAIVCVELGSYCGYSTVRMASQLKNEHSVIYCIEREPACCLWTKRLCEKAGLSSKVCVLEGDVDKGIDTLRSKGIQIDVLFIDHDKVAYLNDLKSFEASGLLKSPGAYVVADNILSFGVSLEDYLEHVRKPVGDGGHYRSSILHRRTVEYSTTSDVVERGSEMEDGIEISILN